MSQVIRNANMNDRDKVFMLATQFATSFSPNRELFEVSFNHLMSDESACLLVADVSDEIVG